MKLTSLEAILAALNGHKVRFLIVGGLAVAAHGYIRHTQDVDLVIALDHTNILRTFEVLKTLGYKPTVPITAEQFADRERRKEWIKNKSMKVLNFSSDLHRETTIDVFVDEPFDFEREYERAWQGELAPGLSVRFVSLPTLIAMKEQANRPRDLDDLHHLRQLAEEQKHE